MKYETLLGIARRRGRGGLYSAHTVGVAGRRARSWMSNEVTAVRRKQNLEGVKLGVYSDTYLTPYCVKVASKWRQVCQRPNGSWYISTRDGEITLPVDLIMVLESLATRNADSGRSIERLGRNQAIGGSRLLAARIEALAICNTPEGK